METIARMIIQEPLEVYEAPRYINITQIKDLTVVETMLIIIVLFLMVQTLIRLFNR